MLSFGEISRRFLSKEVIKICACTHYCSLRSLSANAPIVSSILYLHGWRWRNLRRHLALDELISWCRGRCVFSTKGSLDRRLNLLLSGLTKIVVHTLVGVAGWLYMWYDHRLIIRLCCDVSTRNEVCTLANIWWNLIKLWRNLETSP
jgi:hypothetical protein